MNLPIVVIDDDRSWLQAVETLLREEGFDVQTAEDGQQGLQLIETNAPVLVILDMHLPGVSGLEILQDLHRHGLRMPILVVSAEADSSLIAQAMGAGATAFIQKPVAARLLLRAIDRLMHSHPENVSTPGR